MCDDGACGVAGLLARWQDSSLYVFVSKALQPGLALDFKDVTLK